MLLRIAKGGQSMADQLGEKGGNEGKGASETGADACSSGKAPGPGQDTPPSAVWYLLRKGSKKEGPFTPDQLRQVVPTPGLKIRRATDSDWCAWENAARRYPELLTAGILQKAPVAGPSYPGETPAAPQSSATPARRRKRQPQQHTSTSSPADSANRISAWKGLFCMGLTVAIWVAGAPFVRWLADSFDLPVNQVQGWLLAQSSDRPDPALQCRFFAGFWERCVVGACWGALFGFLGGLLYGPLGCSLTAFVRRQKARTPEGTDRGPSGSWPADSLALGLTGFLVGPPFGVLFAAIMLGFVVNGLIIGLVYAIWGLFGSPRAVDLTFSLWGVAFLGAGTAISLFYRQVTLEGGRDILTFRGRFLVVPLFLAGAIGWVSWAAVPDSPQLVLQNHTAPITRVVFSHDSQFLASAGKDGTVCVWRMPEGQLTHTLQGHKDAVSCLAFHPTQPWLATGGDDGTVRLWKDGKEVQRGTLGRKINALAFHPDGKRLAVHVQTSFFPGEEEAALQFLDVSTWTPVSSKRFMEKWACLSLAFSPDGSLLAATYEFQSSLTVFDGNTGEALPGIRSRDESPRDRSDVNRVVFPDNGAVLLGGTGQRVLWKSPIPAGKSKTLCGRPSWYSWPDEGSLEVVDLSLLRSKSLLATAGGDNTVRVYHAGSGQLVCRFHQPAAVETVGLGYRDQVLLATGGADGTVRVWKLSRRLW
jgi:WD40 repeat protein